MIKYNYVIPKNYNNYNIRDFLSSFKISESKINRIVNEKKYLVNDFWTDVLHTNDILTIDGDVFNEKQITPIVGALDILYEDENVLVVNKPANIIIHADDEAATLDKMVAGYLKNNGYLATPRHIYRLDKDTQGCMLYAKDPLSLSFLSYECENKSMNKTYTAIVEGKIESDGCIDQPIGKHRHENNKMVISKTGKKAITNYKVLGNNHLKTLVDLFLETGRTHQIRVHMSSIGHPIVGDKIYGCTKKGDEMKLQCSSVSFTHPITKKCLTIKVRHKFTL